MKPRVTVITLGVDDLEQSLRFYRPATRLAIGAVAAQEHCARFASNSALCDKSPTELTLGRNVSSQAEVDAVMQQAAAAGARIVKPAHATFWGGYSGYFQDLDDHLWEVVWNPQWEAQ